MELSQVWRVVMRRWVVCALVLGVCLAGSVYLAYSPPDRYRATALLLAEPAADDAGSFAAVSFLLPSLQVQLTTASTADAAAAEVPREVRGAAVGVGSSVEQGTGILRITTDSTDPAAVAPWANAYARALVAGQPADGPVRLRAIDPAVTPGGPSGPVRTDTLVSGAVLGLLLAVALALLLEWLARHRYLPGQIRDRFGVPVLGEIPRLGPAAGTPAPDLLATGDPVLVETFMRARTGLELQLTTRHVTSVCVTSLGGGEGKSTIAATLAWALASAGHDVALVEADVRRPVMRALAVPGGGLTAPAELGTTVFGAAAPGGPSLDLVDAADLVTLAEGEPPAARRAPHPAEVVTVALPRALHRLERPTAVVVVDAPPLLGAAEASLAARSVSGVVVVVDVARRHVLDRVEQALSRVDEAGGTVLGVVLNRTRRRRREEAGYAVAAPTQAPQPPAGPDPSRSGTGGQRRAGSQARAE